MARQLLLKTFSGPNLGAEFVLADGEYLLGRGADCDLVFDDLSLADQHVRITIAGEQAKIVPLGDARVFVAGKPTDGCTLPIQEYLTIGTTHLAIGFADERWPIKPLPVIRFEEQVTPAPIAEPVAPQKVKSTKDVRRRWMWTLAGCAVVAPVVLLTAWMILVPSVRASVISHDDTGEELRRLLEEHKVSETVEATKFESGWVVKGHLATRAARLELMADCKKIISENAIKLWDSETLAAATGEVLAAFRVAVQAKPAGPGVVEVAGRVPDAALWARVRERIRHDVPAIETLTDNVIAGTAPPRKDGPGRPLATNKSPTVADSGKVLIPVPYPVQISEEPDSSSTVAAKAEKPNSKPPILAFQSVSIGASSWLRLADGTRVSVGGRLGDGYEVISITEDEVVARRGETRVIYRLREGG